MEMRKKIVLSYFMLLFMLLLAACGPKDAEPTATPDDIPSANAEKTEVLPTPTSETFMINLAGPDIGTIMEWVDGSLMVYIPSGEFIMGQGGEDNPEHTVYLRDFWIYRTKVTNQMYAGCVAAGGCSAPENEPADYYLDPEHAEEPIIGVNWEQAATYCSWVEGALPTEAQWEKTARGPDGNIYPWGDSAPNCDLLNFDSCLGSVSNVTDFPAGQSYYEALDMAGNTFEWVLDWYDPTYYEASPSDDPYGPELGEVKSVRSSSFESAAQQVPVANRFFLDPEKKRTDLGFRCVLIDPQPPAPFCVTASRLTSTPERSSSDCEPAEVSEGNSFCRGTSAYINIKTDNPLATITSGGGILNCTQYQAGRLTCGPFASETQVSFTVCAPGCEPSAAADLSGSEMYCMAGFVYNPATGACELASITTDPRGASCAPGYQATPLGCLPTIHNIGGCGTGYYYDAALGACVPTGGASDCFPGYTGYPGEDTCNTSCLEGYVYNADQGCCAPEDGSYMVPGGGAIPACPAGYVYDTGANTCLPANSPSLAGSCSSFTVTAASCYEKPKDDQPSGCAQYDIHECGEGNACYWDTFKNTCLPYGSTIN